MDPSALDLLVIILQHGFLFQTCDLAIKNVAICIITIILETRRKDFLLRRRAWCILFPVLLTIVY